MALQGAPQAIIEPEPGTRPHLNGSGHMRRIPAEEAGQTTFIRPDLESKAAPCRVMQATIRCPSRKLKEAGTKSGRLADCGKPWRPTPLGSLQFVYHKCRQAISKMLDAQLGVEVCPFRQSPGRRGCFCGLGVLVVPIVCSCPRRYGKYRICGLTGNLFSGVWRILNCLCDSGGPHDLLLERRKCATAVQR